MSNKFGIAFEVEHTYVEAGYETLSVATACSCCELRFYE
jgi:hypothetical protein